MKLQAPDHAGHSIKVVDTRLPCPSDVRQLLDEIQEQGYAFQTLRHANVPPQPAREERCIEYPDPGDWVPAGPGRPRKSAPVPKPKLVKVERVRVQPAVRTQLPKAPAAARPPKPAPAPKAWEPMKRPTVILNPAEEVGCDVKVALTGSYPVGAAETRMKAGWRQGQCLTCGRWRWGDEPCSKARYDKKPRIRL